MKLEIQRVEIPELQRLEKGVAETAALVADWKRTVADIETQANVANLALARAKKARETHALQSARGDAAALEAVKRARSEQLAAEQIIGDLTIALPEALAHLANAERAAESARHELAKFHAEVLIRRRIDVAGQLDQVTANFARLYGEYQKLGVEIIDMPDAMPKNLHGMSNVEGAVGARRVRASLPAFFWKLFPGALYDEMKTENLATSEARFWNLPPEQPKVKAA
jgi:hypothetical protein